MVMSISSKSQCTINSTGCGGYKVEISIYPLSIVPSSTLCPVGYNYNVRFAYKIRVYGINTCYNGNIGIQPQILCNSQNNGYYTISVPAPTVGAPTSTVVYTGTLTTTTNPYVTNTDCNTATTASRGCTGLQVTVFGPGYPTTTYPCTLLFLPVELVSFEADCYNNKLHLFWKTYTETNNKEFIIEKSLDAINWKTISSIPGSNNSNTPKNYNFTTNQYEFDPVYYRIKQIDYSGKYMYSNVISVDNCNKNKFYSDFQFIQNPVETIIDLKDNNYKQILIFNQLGEVVKEQNSGNTIDLSSNPIGIYFIKIVLNNGNIISNKIIKAN